MTNRPRRDVRGMPGMHNSVWKWNEMDRDWPMKADNFQPL